MSQSPRIHKVGAETESVLMVTWSDAVRDRIDLAGWISTGGSALEALKQNAVFQNARVSDYGLAVAWDEDGDIAIDSVHLRRIAEEQRPFATEDLVAWQKTTGMSNNEAADFLDISLNTWKNFRAGADIPKRYNMVLKAALRDPVLVHAHFKPRVAGRPPKAAG